MLQVRQYIGNMTPIDEFKLLLPPDRNLTEDEIITMRDLIDEQADTILDAYIQDKADGKI